MKRRLATLALALLFLLPACSRQAKDDAYHWIPPEKKIAQTYDIPPYDPSSGLTYEQYLTTLDVPIVVSLERNNNTAPLLDLSKFSIDIIRSYPHVTDVSFPTLLHWLDNFCGEQIIQFPKEFIERNGIHRKDVQYAPMEKATLMIGQYQSALKEEQIGEGRKWTDMRECCVNRALYEKLLAYEKAEFTGLGDTITVTETLYQRGVMRETKEEGLSITPRDRTIHEYTVVGIVEDEGEYANTDAYGFFHIYTSMDMVKNLVAKHDTTQRPFYVDEAFYYPTQNVSSLTNSSVIFYNRDPEDPEQIRIRLEGNRILSLEEYDAYFRDVPENAGYLVEITLDSGKSFAEFQRLIMEETRFRTNSKARGWYLSMWNNHQNVLQTKPDEQLKLPQLLQEVYDSDELDEWYITGVIPRVVRPLRAAGG